MLLSLSSSATSVTANGNSAASLQRFPSSSSSSFRVKMSSSESHPLPSVPENHVVLGCGAAVVDFLAAVAAFPNPDDKIRTTSLKVQGGGNAGNALTCAARLGLNPRLISKVADDSQGRGVLTELQADGVDTSFFVVAKEGNSPFTYVIVDEQTKTRTCIHTPGYPPMIPDDLSQSSISSALNGATLVYFDGRLHETALVIAQEATRKNIPILIDAEKKREGLDDLVNLATYVVCSAKFPQLDRDAVALLKRIQKFSMSQDVGARAASYIFTRLSFAIAKGVGAQIAWTEAATIPSALVAMLLRLPKLKFVIVTLGEDGCIMLERCSDEVSLSEEIDVDSLLESLEHRKNVGTVIPTCISSPLTRIRAKGIGTISGRMFVGTAEKIPPAELLDTTGAGDAFIGSVLYAICANMPPERMLPFAAQVAGAGCRGLGARTALPRRTDPRLVPFLL